MKRLLFFSLIMLIALPIAAQKSEKLLKEYIQQPEAFYKTVTFDQLVQKVNQNTRRQICPQKHHGKQQQICKDKRHCKQHKYFRRHHKKGHRKHLNKMFDHGSILILPSTLTTVNNISRKVQRLKRHRFEELISQSNKDNYKVRILAHKKRRSKNFDEIFCFIQEKEKIVLISIIGKFNLNDFTHISNSLPNISLPLHTK